MLTLAGTHTLEREIKKSRFIARAARAESREGAAAFIEAVREPRATHNCWAYRIGADYRFSDDGEPGGTAGQPILHAIDGQGLDQVVVVVTRFFGGVKLGAGGLARAYGGTAAECLRQASRVEMHPLVAVRITVPFELTGAVYTLISARKARRLAEQHTGAGLVLEVSLPADALEAFQDGLRDATRGQALLEVIR